MQHLTTAILLCSLLLSGCYTVIGSQQPAAREGSDPVAADTARSDTTKSSNPLITAELLHLYRDPGTALLLGVLVPGGGHIYAGERAMGIAALSIGFGAPVLAIVTSSPQLYGEIGSTNLTITAAVWIFSIIDGRRAAIRTNRRHGLALKPSDDGAGLVLAIRF